MEQQKQFHGLNLGRYLSFLIFMAQMFEMLYKQEIGNQDGNLLIKRKI